MTEIFKIDLSSMGMIHEEKTLFGELPEHPIVYWARIPLTHFLLFTRDTSKNNPTVPNFSIIYISS